MSLQPGALGEAPEDQGAWGQEISQLLPIALQILQVAAGHKAEHLRTKLGN